MRISTKKTSLSGSLFLSSEFVYERSSCEFVLIREFKLVSVRRFDSDSGIRFRFGNSNADFHQEIGVMPICARKSLAAEK